MAWTNAVILNSTRSLTKSLALALWRAQRSLSKQTFWPSPGQSMTTYENYWKLLHLFTKHGTKTLALGQHSASISFPAPQLTQHNRHEKLITLARSMQVTLLWMMQWRSKSRMNQIWMTRPGLALYIHGLLMDEDCRCCIKKYLSQRPVSQKQVEYGRSDVVVHILFRFHLVVRRKLPLFPASTHWVHSSSLTWWWGWAKEYLARDQFLPISWEFGFKNLEHGQWPLLPWFHVSRSDKSLALRHLLHFALHCISEGVWSIGHSKFAFAVGSWTLCCTLCWWVPLFLCSFVFTPCKSLAAVLLMPLAIQVYWGRASGSSGFDLARGRGPASYSSHVFICTLESHVVNLRWYTSNWYGVRYQLFKICMDWRFLVSQCFTYFQNVFFVKLTGQTAARRCLASRTPACGNWSAGLQKISFFLQAVGMICHCTLPNLTEVNPKIQ